ncbi:MAG: metallophosphoesterase [Candidatus Berkelbacteria bacterium]
MKAFLFADLHGSYKQLRNIESYLKNNPIDLILFAGDLTNMGEPVEFAKLWLDVLADVKIPFFWVPGNNDFGRGYYRLAAKYPSLEGRTMEFPLFCHSRAGGNLNVLDRARDDKKVLKFTGVGGSPASWAGQYQGETTDQKIEIGGTIFISHVPPPGLLNLLPYDKILPSGCHSGLDPESRHSVSARKFSDAPLIHICGHIHSRQGIGFLGQTKVIKLGDALHGNYGIMDLETLFVEFGRFSDGNTYRV